MAVFALRLFGPFEVRVAGALLPPVRSRRGQWALALLALRRGAEVQRSWLAGSLWPDSSEDQSRGNLRRTLTDLRRALAGEAWRLRAPTPHTLRLDLSDAEVDLPHFEDALARGDAASLETAAVLYRGPLLEGWTEDWVAEPRRMVQEAYLAALERAAAAESARGEAAIAARSLRRAVTVDPLRETAQRSLMRSLAGSGEFGAALEVYRDLRALLYRELNTAPDAETVALFRQIRSEARREAGASEARSLPTSPSPTPPRPGLPLGSRIPCPLTALIGREEEVRALRSCLAATRLLTLTGSGGVGKTRLAIQVAEEVRADYADGALFVDLAGLTEPSLLAPAIAALAGAPEAPGRPPGVGLEDFLQDREALLVLDNCEHLIDSTAELAQALLAACPHLTILATSRRSLGIVGERVWRVPTLSLPSGAVSGRPDQAPPPPSAQALLACGAVQLFARCAAAVEPSFKISDRNGPSVLEICRRLDGIPLAIELAAARLSILSPEDIAARLGRSLQLLSGASRSLPARQRTLQATLDWSFNLLSPGERALLCRLSVFNGAFTLDAARDVGAGEGVRDEEVIDLLSGLVDQSVVWVSPARPAAPPGADARFRLPEPIRQYAGALLAARGEADDRRRRHAVYYLELAERARPLLETPDEPVWLDCLEAAQPNLREALAWWTSPRPEGTPEEGGLKLAAALWHFWWTRAHWTEGRYWLERALSDPHGSRDAARSSARAAARAAAGFAALIQRDPANARAHMEEGLAIYRGIGSGPGAARALNHLAWMAHRDDDNDTARELFSESLALLRQAGSRMETAGALNGLGVVAQALGDYRSARLFHEECLAINQDAGNSSGAAWTLKCLGETAHAEGRLPEAEASYARGFSLFRGLGHHQGMMACLLELALLGSALTGAPEPAAARAARMLGAAEALAAELGVQLKSWSGARSEEIAASLRASLGGLEYARYHGEGPRRHWMTCSLAWRVGTGKPECEPIARTLVVRSIYTQALALRFAPDAPCEV